MTSNCSMLFSAKQSGTQLSDLLAVVLQPELLYQVGLDGDDCLSESDESLVGLFEGVAVFVGLVEVGDGIGEQLAVDVAG